MLEETVEKYLRFLDIDEKTRKSIEEKLVPQLKKRRITEEEIWERIGNWIDKRTELYEERFMIRIDQQQKDNKQKQLVKIRVAEEKIKETEEEIKRLKFWKEAFSKTGIPSMLIDQAIPLMNRSMRKYLELLSNGRYIVTFDTISQTKSGEYRDKFSVNILDTKTQVNNKKQLSGGQTRLIDIATILTLRDLKKDLGEVDFNLFAFDEIFDALDDENIGSVCGILNSIKEDRSILVVSHRHQDQLEADSHIQLR